MLSMLQHYTKKNYLCFVCELWVWRCSKYVGEQNKIKNIETLYTWCIFHNFVKTVTDSNILNYSTHFYNNSSNWIVKFCKYLNIRTQKLLLYNNYSHFGNRKFNVNYIGRVMAWSFHHLFTTKPIYKLYLFQF